MNLNVALAKPVASPIVLISPYELGRQPFALAEPAAQLRAAGHGVRCIDLSQQSLDAEQFANARVVAIYLGMHTATRIALEALDKLHGFAPDATFAAYGLYAPVNAAMLRERGIAHVFGAECENDLLQLAAQVLGGTPPRSRTRVEFMVPDRSDLPALSRYAQLQLPDGESRTVGFVEASRGCKHKCRHCPVVPVYHGRFRAVPAEIVLADIRQQVAAGARHISFGDPDFLNGPTHAARIIERMHAQYPQLTWDAVVKVQHLIDHADLLPHFALRGCLFLTSAVESLDDAVLRRLEKNHTREDFEHAVGLMRNAGIGLAPTFIPFTPWTSIDDYLDLLDTLVRLELVHAVPPVQLSIRLLIPAGSYLLELPGFRDQLDGFDANALGYQWRHADPRIDALQREIQDWIARAEQGNVERTKIFAGIWRRAHDAAGRAAPALPEQLGKAIPAMSEPWYCCAEPTEQQLASI